MKIKHSLKDKTEQNYCDQWSKESIVVVKSIKPVKQRNEHFSSMMLATQSLSSLVSMRSMANK